MSSSGLSPFPDDDTSISVETSESLNVLVRETKNSSGTCQHLTALYKIIVTMLSVWVLLIATNLFSLYLKSIGCAPLKTICQSLAPVLHCVLPQVSFCLS